MVRLSKQKQEKLENIMNLVEELGVDRVLARLRQTKMMSKEVLDDMKEWETDYEKRVALLGFLVSPEGKRAFGALFELAKVHEEQVRLQEEQEKLRQEQLAQQAAAPAVESRRGAVHGPAGGGGRQAQTGASNMKSKMRAQMNKRKAPTSQPAQQQNSHHGNASGKTKKAATKKQEDKEDPLLEEAARTLKEAQRQVQEKKRIDAMRSQLEASEARETSSTASGRRSAGSPRTTPTPRSEGAQRPVTDSPKLSQIAPKSTATESDLTASSSSKRKSSESKDPHPVETPKSPTEAKRSVIKAEPNHLPKALNDFTRHKEEERHKMQEGEWGKLESLDAEEDDDKEELEVSERYPQERLPPEGESIKEDERDYNKTSSPTSKKKYSSPAEVAKEPSSPDVILKAGDDVNFETQKFILNSNLSGPILKLLSGELEAHCMKRCDLGEVVAEWRILRKERGGHIMEAENKMKIIHQLKEETRAIEEEKERMRKEKDRFVYKEFDLQQKLQDLTQKHRNLKEDHDSLKQGNYQIQQNTKKNNKLHQEMKKKIAKLESKIKSMDKVTIRRGTQTEDHLDKDVYEALRMAQESLSVTESDLASALAKLKTAQQEVDEYKKQINIKGREINKRERKSKKDEDTIRFMSRERDAMEGKLRKITEQMEYYKGMADTKGKVGTKKTPEKKEVKVQRCASGRHVLVKSVTSSQQHDAVLDSDDKPRVSRPSTVKQSSKSKTVNAEKQTSKKSNSSAGPAKSNTSVVPPGADGRAKQAASSVSADNTKAEAVVSKTSSNIASNKALSSSSTFNNTKSTNQSSGKTLSQQTASSKTANSTQPSTDTNREQAANSSKQQPSNNAETKSNKVTSDHPASNHSKTAKKSQTAVETTKPRKSSLKDGTSVVQVAKKT